MIYLALIALGLLCFCSAGVGASIQYFINCPGSGARRRVIESIMWFTATLLAFLATLVPLWTN